MKSLFKKEISYYFNNPIGYIAAILFVIFANFLFVKDLFLRGDSSMRPFFDLLPWLLMIFVPALSMRVFAEEKRANTIEILLTMPIAESFIAIAKFIALIVFSVFVLSLTFLIPVTLSIVGKPAILEIIVSYMGSLLLISSFISISMFFSSSTDNQMVAFLGSALTIFLLMVLGTDFFASFLPRTIQEIFSPFLMIYHYGNFLKGLIDLRAVFYFTSLTILFIFFTIVNLEKRQ